MFQPKIILGITGTCAAGKDTIANYLIKNYGFAHHSCSEILRDELKRRNIKKSIANLAAVGNEMRRNFGNGILAKELLDKVFRNREEKIVITSLRHPDEIKELKMLKSCYVVGADAPISVRYERVRGRKNERDQINFEKFKEEEERQMRGTGAEMKIAECLNMVDFKISNDKGFEELYRKIEEIMQKVLK